MIKKYAAITLTILLAVSCSLFDNAFYENRSLNPVEEFTSADSPVTFSHEGMAFTSPWGYSKSKNASREYPLLVSGCWGEGEGNYKDVEQSYPAFVLDYQKNATSDGEILALWIESAVHAGYRINTNRIYLTGFSMGGSGSFPLARGMYNKGKYFAAIIRVAGQSQSDIGNDIASVTALWYHIGLEDTEQRVTIARDVLEYNRNYECNKNSSEMTETDDITGYNRKTITLTRKGIPVFKYSEYEDMSHTPSPCYKDPKLFSWLFAHSL